VGLVTAGVDMKGVNPHLFEFLGDPEPFFLFSSPFEVVGNTKTVNNGKIFTGIAFYCFNCFTGQGEALLRGTTVAVVTPVP
jgi:hypothetical protein